MGDPADRAGGAGAGGADTATPTAVKQGGGRAGSRGQLAPRGAGSTRATSVPGTPKSRPSPASRPHADHLSPPPGHARHGTHATSQAGVTPPDTADAALSDTYATGAGSPTTMGLPLVFVGHDDGEGTRGHPQEAPDGRSGDPHSGGGIRTRLRSLPKAERRRLLTRVGALASAIGLLLALVALPVVGGVALFAKSSADHFLNLPSVLLTPPLPESSILLAKDGTTEIARLRGTENRVIAEARDIPDVIRKAIVAIEDARFYAHSGFDPQGVVRAALRNSEAGDVTEGGSTLTQQYVKNVLLQTARTAEQREAVAGASVDRKIQELRYAVELEKRMSKDDILVGYLNIAYFGDGAYGVGTAAQHFFGAPINKITLDQAALLAGLVQSPSRFDPVNNPEAARERRNVVLDRMAAEGYVTPGEAAAAKSRPVDVARTTPNAEDSCEPSLAPFFCDYVRTQLLADPALGDDEQERSRRLLEGGLVIQTTLDPKVQNAAQQAVDSAVDRGNRVSATEVVVEPGTGNILAMAVNRTFGNNTAANETKVLLPASTNFQTGSTFKTFTLAAALEGGYGYNTVFYSPSCYVSRKYVIGDNSGRNANTGTCSNGFSNADPAEDGLYDMIRATEDSVNTYYIQLQERVGIPAVVDMALRLGVPAERLEGVGPNDGSLTIGSRPVSPLDMANSYATLAAGGLRCDPRAATKIVDSGGAELDVARDASCQQTVSPQIANTVTDVLTHVITSGTGHPNATVVGRPAAGKTGTTDGYSSAWFVGYTPQLAAAVTVADPLAPVAKPLRNVQAGGRTWPKVYGGDLPAIIWGQTMRAAHAGLPVKRLPGRDPSTAAGTKGGMLSLPPVMPAPSPAPTPGVPGAPGAPGILPSGQPGQPGVFPQPTDQVVATPQARRSRPRNPDVRASSTAASP